MRTLAWAIKTKTGLVRPEDRPFWEVRVPLLFRTKKLAVEYLRTKMTYGKGIPVRVKFEITEVENWREL